MHFYHHLFIACESWLCGLKIETLMETTISLMKNTRTYDDFEISKFWGGVQSQTHLKKGVTFCCWYSRSIPTCWLLHFLLKPLHKCLNNFSRYHSLPELKEKWSVLPSLAKSWKMQQNMVYYRIRVAILKTHHLATQKFSKYPPPPALTTKWRFKDAPFERHSNIELWKGTESQNETIQYFI